MQINLSEHTQQPWICHDLLKDFEVEDVWRYPVKLDEAHSLDLFRDEMMTGLEKLQEKGLPGLLFKLRLFLGQIFSWEQEVEEHPLMAPGSLRERYAKESGIDPKQLPAPGSDSFVPVYQLKDESLAEIKNATVHAGLHLGKVPTGKDSYTVQMAVYVKPNGFWGKRYMDLIRPFRYYIVYPVLMNTVGDRWKEFLKNSEEPKLEI